MTYTVIWQPAVEEALTSIWHSATDRRAVTDAANEIDRRLRFFPDIQGEQRSGRDRVLVVPPLAVGYEWNQEDRIVRVLGIRHRQSPPTV